MASSLFGATAKFVLYGGLSSCNIKDSDAAARHWGMTQRLCFILDEPSSKSMFLTATTVMVNLLAAGLLHHFNTPPLLCGLVALIGLGGPLVYIRLQVVPGGKMDHITDVAAPRRLYGKKVLITGASSGIGAVTAKQLAKWGAHVIMACRDVTKGQKVREEFIRNHDVNPELLEVLYLDLSDLDCVKEFCHKLRSVENFSLDILINNAGIMFPGSFQRTKQGYELQFGTNYIGHFLLTKLLMGDVVKAKGRIITLSSKAHCFGPIVHLEDVEGMTKASYDRAYAYGLSKTAAILFTEALDRRFAKGGLGASNRACAYSCHPGTVATSLLQRHIDMNTSPFYFFSKSPEQGAQTTLLLTAGAKDYLQAGTYYADCEIAAKATSVCDNVYSEKLWDWSEKQVLKWL